MAKVSVVIPFRNSEAYIVGCVRSVLAQTLSELEVICVDNGSTDGSRTCVERFGALDRRVRLISCVQPGAGHARNAGMAVAEGDFFAFIDADDYLLERSSLERLHRHAVESDSELSRGNVYIAQDRVEPIVPLMTLGVEVCWRTDVVTSYDQEPLLWLPVQHQAYLIRRRFVEDNRLTYPGLLRGQDAPFLLSALLKANSIHCSNEAYYVYRKGHRNHVVLKGTHFLADFVTSVLEVRELLLQGGRVRQWHLVLARTCGYLRRVCPPCYLLSEASLVTVLRTMVENCSSLGRLSYSPYCIDEELENVRAMADLIGRAV